MNPRLETGLQIQQPKSYPYIFDSEEVLSASERLTLLREMCGPFSWVLEAEEGWGEKKYFYLDAGDRPLNRNQNLSEAWDLFLFPVH